MASSAEGLIFAFALVALIVTICKWFILPIAIIVILAMVLPRVR